MICVQTEDFDVGALDVRVGAHVARGARLLSLVDARAVRLRAEPVGSEKVDLVKALAAGAITRLDESGDTDVKAWGFSPLVADAQARLGSLTEALAAGCPDLLRLEVEWLATTYAARQVPVEFLDKTLGCLRDELADRLPTDAAAMACARPGPTPRTLSSRRKVSRVSGSGKPKSVCESSRTTRCVQTRTASSPPEAANSTPSGTATS